jgi:hypothetical protein
LFILLNMISPVPSIFLQKICCHSSLWLKNTPLHMYHLFFIHRQLLGT